MYPKSLPGWGVNISFGQGKKIHPDTITTACKNLRCERVRIEFDSYLGIDHNYMLTLVTTLYAADIKILGVLSPIVPGSLRHILSGDYDRSYAYQHRQEWFLQFCLQCVQEYGPYVHTRQLRNEQNTRRFRGDTPDAYHYAQCLGQIIDAVQSSHPLRYLPGSVMGDRSRVLGWHHHQEFLSQTLKHIDHSYHDTRVGIAFHPYDRTCYIGRHGPQFHYDNIVKRIDDCIAAFQSERLWITEYGISRRWTSLNTDQIAQLYTDLYVYCHSQAIPFFVRGLLDIDHGFHDRNPEKYFNLLDSNGEVTALYDSLATRLHLLSVSSQ